MSCDSHVIIMTIIATWFSETVRHGISTKVGVKIWNFSSSTMPQGSILGANKIQPRICHFCRAEQKGVFWGPLALGTENGHGWELSSQILQLACQVIILSVDTHCHWCPSSVRAKRPRLCRSVDFGRPSCSMMTFEFTTGYVMTMIHAIMTARASVFIAILTTRASTACRVRLLTA